MLLLPLHFKKYKYEEEQKMSRKKKKKSGNSGIDGAILKYIETKSKGPLNPDKIFDHFSKKYSIEKIEIAIRRLEKRGLVNFTDKEKVAKKKSARKPSAAFMKPLTPSAHLAAVVGAKAMPRTEVVKKIWVYIKANKLQDKANKRMINADAKLKAVFGGKSQVSMFDMAKHLAKNLS